MRNPGFPNDDLARAALLVKCHEAAQDDHRAGKSLITQRALDDLGAVREEFNSFLELYTTNMIARDTVQVDEPARPSGTVDELEQKLLDARRKADRIVRRVCAEINAALGGEDDEAYEETYRRYGFSA
jgi:hypothetical protein